MAGRQAKVLSANDLHDLFVFASCTRNPLRNRVLVLLSAKAGLRAGEVANLTWAMVTDASGRISGVIELPDSAARKCGGRSIPLHPDLMGALAEWRLVAPSTEYVIASERGGAMTPLSIVLATPTRSASWFRSFDDGGQSKSPSPCRPEAKPSSPQQKEKLPRPPLTLVSTRCARSRRSGGPWCLLPRGFGYPY
jgi:hypothetical protein